jgi:hypothetical protein
VEVVNTIWNSCVASYTVVGYIRLREEVRNFCDRIDDGCADDPDCIGDVGAADIRL